MKARVSNLIKTEEEWLKLNFKPLAGELIIYAPDKVHAYPRLKVGDGSHTLHDLPFAIEAIAYEALSKYQQAECYDAGRITDYLKV
jgi:hypothetical protein